MRADAPPTTAAARRRQGAARKTPEDLVIAFLEAAGADISQVLSRETKQAIAEEVVREARRRASQLPVKAAWRCRSL